MSWEDFGLALVRAGGRRAFRVSLPEFMVRPRLLALFPPARAAADRLGDLLAERWDGDHARAREEMAWSAAMPLEDGLRRTWEWYQRQGWI